MKKLLFIGLLISSPICCNDEKQVISLDSNEMYIINVKEFDNLILHKTREHLKKESMKHRNLWISKRYTYLDFIKDVLAKTLAFCLTIIIKSKIQNFTYSRVT